MRTRPHKHIGETTLCKERRFNYRRFRMGKRLANKLLRTEMDVRHCSDPSMGSIFRLASQDITTVLEIASRSGKQDTELELNPSWSFE